jgi:hypothetical protein
MSEAVSLCRQLFSVPIYILFTSYVTDHAFAVLPVPRLLGYSCKRSHVWGCPMPELIHTSPADRVLPDEHHFTGKCHACQRHCIQLGATHTAALQNNSFQGGPRFSNARSGDWVWFRGQLLKAFELT